MKTKIIITHPTKQVMFPSQSAFTTLDISQKKLLTNTQLDSKNLELNQQDQNKIYNQENQIVQNPLNQKQLNPNILCYKAAFYYQPKPKEFNYQFCGGCFGDGNLLYCSLCPKTYHRRCYKMAEYKFICDTCQLSLKNQCSKCRIIIKENYIRCFKCRSVFHSSCFEVSEEIIKLAPINKLSKKSSELIYICSFCFNFMSIEKIITSNFIKGEEIFLVKLGFCSFMHCLWLKKSQLEFLNATKLNNFLKVNEIEEISEIQIDDLTFGSDYIRECYYQVERIIDRFKAKYENNEGKIALVKWVGLDYNNLTYEWEHDLEDFKSKIDFFDKVISKSLNGLNNQNMDSFSSKQKKRLLDFQVEGVDWIYKNWFKRRNIILGDEMGLGKTIQLLSFLRTIFEKGKSNGPFLICVPLSTLENWSREIEEWFPEASYVIYHGNIESRNKIVEYEFYSRDERKRIKELKIRFVILLTTFEYLYSDHNFFKTLNWQVICIDEGHKIKSEKSKIRAGIAQIPSKFKIILTGTPIQNNFNELENILAFLSPDSIIQIRKLIQEFNLDEELKTKVLGNKNKKIECNVNQEKKELIISNMRKEISEIMLRRLKVEVIKELPSKVETVIRIDMTLKQLNIYKHLLRKNGEYLIKLSNSSDISLMKSGSNLLMTLRLCSNHPLMLSKVYNPNRFSLRSHNEDIIGEVKENDILELSGKMTILDKLLEKLKSDGHRVLIFTQFLVMQQIIADFLLLRKYLFETLNGQDNQSLRQQAIDRFNSPESKSFAFILTTRAGGMGINLVSADTVIIFDSDFNPQMDVQALSRCHRIGQKKKVIAYRFISKNTVEENMLESSKNKVLIEHICLKKDLSNSTINSLLIKGAQKLFGKENENAKPNSDLNIDNLIKMRNDFDPSSNDILQSFQHQDICLGGTNIPKDIETDKELNSNTPKWEDIITLDEDPHELQDFKKRGDEVMKNSLRTIEFNKLILYEYLEEKEQILVKGPFELKTNEENKLDEKCLINAKNEIENIDKNSTITMNINILDNQLMVTPSDFIGEDKKGITKIDKIREFIVIWDLTEYERQDILIFIMRFGVNINDLNETCKQIRAFKSSIFNLTSNILIKYLNNFFSLLNELKEKQLGNFRFFLTGPFTINQVLQRNLEFKVIIKKFNSEFKAQLKSHAFKNEIKWSPYNDKRLIKAVLLYGFDSWDFILSYRLIHKKRNKNSENNINQLAKLIEATIPEMKNSSNEELIKEFLIDRVKFLCNTEGEIKVDPITLI